MCRVLYVFVILLTFVITNWYQSTRFFVQVENGCIKMTNSSVSQVAGIGSIQIRTHDGRFCTLNNVRHVPSMEKNLISLSLLDSRGLKYSGGDGILQVYQGSDVILKGVIVVLCIYYRGSLL